MIYRWSNIGVRVEISKNYIWNNLSSYLERKNTILLKIIRYIEFITIHRIITRRCAERNTKYLLDEHVLIYFGRKKKKEREKKIFTNDKVNQSSLANRLITISLLIVIEPNRSLFFNIHCDFDFDFVRSFVRVCFLCQCAKYTAKLDVIFAYSSEGYEGWK